LGLLFERLSEQKPSLGSAPLATMRDASLGINSNRKNRRQGEAASGTGGKSGLEVSARPEAIGTRKSRMENRKPKVPRVKAQAQVFVHARQPLWNEEVAARR